MHCPAGDDAFVSSYRQDAAKRQTAGITHRPKIRFFARSGDSLHRFRSNFAGPPGTGVRLAVQNFTSIGAEGWECGPKNIKNFHFLAESPRRGDSLDRFRKFSGAFIRLISYVSVSNFM